MTITALTDPVCGMSVTPDSDYQHQHEGADYYFCCAGCQQKFEQEPEKYIKQSVAERPK